MFGTLNEKLEKIVKSIIGRATISEDDLDITLREIRISLLEADVALSVVKILSRTLNRILLDKKF